MLRLRKNKPRRNALDFRMLRSPRVEIKQIGSSLSRGAYYDAAAGSILVDITAIAQGNTGATRVGDMASLQQLLFSMYIVNGTGATANAVTISRILFVQYFGDSSVAGKPTIAELFNASNANAGNTYGTHSAFDIDYARIYRVLSDKRYMTFGAPAGQTSTFVGWAAQAHYSIPLGRAQREITYFAGATTGPNHIFLIITSDQATIATNPLISYNLDIRFTDS